MCDLREIEYKSHNGHAIMHNGHASNCNLLHLRPVPLMIGLHSMSTPYSYSGPFVWLQRPPDYMSLSKHALHNRICDELACLSYM